MEKILRNITNRTFQELSCKRDLDYSLLGGDFGKIMFLYCASSRHYCCREEVDALLGLMLSSIGNKPLISTYCNGLAGLSVGLKALEELGFIDGASESICVFQGLLSQRIQEWLNHDLDFLHGAIGLGMYFILRSTIDKSAYSVVKSILSFLDNHAYTDSNEGIYWLYPNKDNVLTQNLSLSHGVCSTVMFIARAYNVLNEKDERLRCIRLLTGIGKYLLSNLINPLISGCYTPMLPEKSKSRLGWFYGDIGTCIALRTIGEITNDITFVNFSREIAYFIALNRKDLKNNFVYDACLCHGTSGIAHFFKNCYDFYQDSIFETALNNWINNTLKMCQNNNEEYMFGSFRYED